MYKHAFVVLWLLEAGGCIEIEKLGGCKGLPEVPM